MTFSQLGITVLPEYVQSEGVPGVVEILADRIGATSMTTSPYVAEPAKPGEGNREPPIDGGAGKGRLLDRPLWGQREVWMTAACSFKPHDALYEGLTYRPPAVNELTEQHGAVVASFLDATKARGLETWMQIQAAIPPCHRVQFGGPVAEDECLMPDGQPVSGRVDRNASLASDNLRRYMKAFLTDLCDAYPQVDGFKFDWPEYPVYQFESLLFDFNEAAARFAPPLGLDFENMRKGCLGFLAELSNGSVRRKRIALDDPDSFRESLMDTYPVLGELIAFRTAIVTDYARFLRETVDEITGAGRRIFLQCFPPPLNVATGFDFRSVSKHCDVIGTKLYTMHWPLIEANYVRWLSERIDVSPAMIASAVSKVLRLSPNTQRNVNEIRYPEPHEPHPCATEDLLAKLKAARREVPEDTSFVAIAHAYGPLQDFERRLEAAREGAEGAVHINRFCYMSDDKIEAISKLANRSGSPDSFQLHPEAVE